jgi:SAM-dependent methyltransferase
MRDPRAHGSRIPDNAYAARRVDARHVFSSIYAADEWKGGSGEGSTIEATEPYRRVLQRVLTARDVASVIDVGCGDWQFSGLVDWRTKSYVGVDVVPELLQRNREIAPSRFEFVCADARLVDLPSADLLVMKDVLQHWPLTDIASFLARNRARFRYMLLTNDIASVHWPADRQNSECELGAWRTIDLECSPFGERVAWRFDFDIRGEWTKRVTLLASPRARIFSWRRGSLLRCLRGFDRDRV